ncbi:MAG: transposase domain-containing protein, partial [Nitrospirae bacterium]|nr:transposase domain-containing protein [Nitrospirota bacterium]
EPYKYLRYIFERLPYARNEEDYKSLLPQYVDWGTFAGKPTGGLSPVLAVDKTCARLRGGLSPFVFNPYSKSGAIILETVPQADNSQSRSGSCNAHSQLLPQT